MKEEKITIVVPIYNLEKYLEVCLVSIMEQTYSNIEIILVNDGSEDHSQQICEKYANRDNRIKVIYQKNGGEIRARYTGFQMATGKYIMFIDGDDWIDKDTIEILYKYHQKYKNPIIRCGYVKEQSKGNKTYMNFQISEPYTLKKEYMLNKLITTYELNSVWNNFVDKSLITDEAFLDAQGITYGGDLLYNLKLYSKCEEILLIPNTLYHYRINESSITQTTNIEKILRNVESCYIVYSKLYDYIISNCTSEQKEFYSQLAMSKLVREFGEIISRKLYANNLENSMQSKRKEVVQEILNRPYFKMIREKLSYEQLIENNIQDKVLAKYIYNNNISKLDEYLMRNIDKKSQIAIE